MDFYGTFGPACQDTETLARLFDSGMTGMRINLSHAGLARCTQWLRNYRAAERMVGKQGQLLIDMQGPELRIGNFTDPICIQEGGTVTLGRGGIPVPDPVLTALRPGMEVLLDDGAISLIVEEANYQSVLCKVARDGVLCSRKSLAVAELPINLPALTQEDMENLRMAADAGVTAVMQPFVRNREDLEEVRAALKEVGAGHIKMFAKIENKEGIQKLPELLDACDHVVIARGDLGNAGPLWELPGLQKEIAAQCRAAGKPFMVVTQLLHSMLERAVPTRAEVSDIYNAVLDGAASLMLTNETAVGNFPVQAMDYLVKTAKAAQK